MKIVLRTLTILAAALLVVAGLNAIAQSSFGQSFLSAGGMSREGGPPPDVAGQGTASGERPSGFEGREGHGDRGPSLSGLAEVGKNLAITAVSVVLIVLGARMLRLDRRDEPRRAATDQPAPLE